MRIAAAVGTFLAGALLLVSVSACGSSTNGAGASTQSTAAATGPRCTADQIQVSTNVGAAPTVTLPRNCGAPTGLLSRDIVPGAGAAIKAGDTISADYQLTTWSNDAMVQQSFGSQPFSTQIGVGQVIAGWDQGLIGQKAGGRRLLVVPPSLGYGDQAQQGIKANETLVFVIDVHSVASG
jgi:peptidylprolyl isomerase